MSRQKYYILEWPECQEYMLIAGCIRIGSCNKIFGLGIEDEVHEPIVLVPCELIDNKNIVI